ncbi:hypothetical protein L3Q82_025220 [Scortum barcoo]|uniref:Uncharacterized protein n=1 Tax=Scortum barcoo TaxID=214431 RepID=A0ACB8WRK8_9TELE|nr:hypothetical protein L3Q82_025220 [Scortum barcoo]
MMQAAGRNEFPPQGGWAPSLRDRRNYVSQLAWESLGIPPEELEEVSGVREVWSSLLRLLPLCDPVPDQADENGWLDGLRPTPPYFRTAETPMTPEPDHSIYPDLSRVPPCYHDLCEVFTRPKPLPCRIDYSALNDITVKNRHPLPLISSAFEQLQQAKIFIKLDLQNTYHLVRIREGDAWKTGFNTPTRHYEYLVMLPLPRLH